MKKIFSMLCAFTVLCSLFGCGEKRLPNGVDVVMDVENLTTTRELSFDEFPDESELIRHDIGLDRHSRRRCGVDLGKRSNTNQRHLQSTRNRGGREG